MTFEEIQPILASDSWMYKDGIANNGEEETIRYLSDYVKEINDLVNSLFHFPRYPHREKQIVEWKFLKVIYSRGLDYYSSSLMTGIPGKEVWVIEVNGKKLGIAQFGRNDPCFVTKESMVANAETHEGFAKTIRTD